MDFRFEVLLAVGFVTDSVAFGTASEIVLLLLLLTFCFFSGGCDCIVDGASLRFEMVEVDGSANFDSGGGRLQLVVVDVDVEPEAEADSPAAICGCITFDDKSHVKLVKSLSLSTSIVVFW